MTGLAQLERQALCTTLAEVGPDAPTLCDGWTTRNLAAHLILRERRPDVAAGMFISPLADRTQRYMDEYTAMEWDALVDMVREGPPGWSPTRLPSVDDAINLAEFYVHHEDVLRAQGDTGAHVREVSSLAQDTMWSRLKQMGQLLFRRSPVGMVLISPDHGQRSVHGPTALGTLTLTGRPNELLLYGYGRGSVAEVTIEGDDKACAALRETAFGV